jgi:hypothetical protein
MAMKIPAQFDQVALQAGRTIEKTGHGVAFGVPYRANLPGR